MEIALHVHVGFGVFCQMYWTDFRKFLPNESVLGADNRSGPFFSISQGSLRWQSILSKKMANSAFSSLWLSETEWDNAVYMHD